MTIINKISLRVFLLFSIAIASTFIPDNLHEFFGDTLCTTGSGFRIWGSNTVGTHYQYCNYSMEHEPNTWHWGYRHWLYLFMTIILFIIQVIDIVIFIVKESEKKDKLIKK